MGLLWDLAIISSLAIIVIYLCYKLKVPVVAAYLITGIILGPNCFALINDRESIEGLSEVGVMLLLFTIGLEFSFKQLSALKRLIFLGGSLYMLFSFLLGVAIFPILIGNKTFGLFLSLLITLSSTAIVLKILQDSMRLDSTHGKITFSILLFQDIAFVPILVILPVLVNINQISYGSLGFLLLKAFALILLTIIGSKYLVPLIMNTIAKTRLRELFLLALLSIFLLMTWVAHILDLSLALGAFLAGLMLSETEYSHQALADFLPFKDIFTSIFFISIGMLVDPFYLIQNYYLVTKLTLIVLLIKFFAGIISTFVIKYPLSIALLVGAYLCQMGEFSFMVGITGSTLGIIEKSEYALFLDSAVITMIFAPFIISFSERLTGFLDKKGFTSKLFSISVTKFGATEDSLGKLSGHVIIIGFGFTGRNVAKVCKITNIPYVIVEMNPETVRREKEKEPIIYGDATREAILKHVKVSEARMVIIAVPDPLCAQKIVELARRMAPFLKIIVRNRYVSQHAPLKNIGADEVVTEEYESAVAILRLLMMELGVAFQKMEEFLSQIKAGGYRFFEAPALLSTDVCTINAAIPDLEIRTWLVPTGSELAGKSIKELEFRSRYGLSILGIKSDDAVYSNPLPDHVIKEGDTLILAGSPRDYAVFQESVFGHG